MKPVLYRRAEPKPSWWASQETISILIEMVIAYVTLALLVLALAGGGAVLFYGLWRLLR